MADRSFESTAALLDALVSASGEAKPIVRSSTYAAYPDGSGGRADVDAKGQTLLDEARSAALAAVKARGGHVLESWKVVEHAYRSHADSVHKVFPRSSSPADIPTLSRGLFTEELSSGPRIVVRGYDKFFNVNEMPWTRTETLLKYTTPPYYLTFKENGCIIFVAALSETEVVVTSKHGLGQLNSSLTQASESPATVTGDEEEASPDFTQGGMSVSHAQKGAEWLDRHLERSDHTRAQLAAELWARNETAVFELCDDAFEEHVLAYDKDNSGLYLHGLNTNSVQFSTRTPPEVDTFARKWGFLPTRFITLDSFAAMQDVVAKVARDGTWEGQPIEGFVVRTTIPTSTPTIEQALASPAAQNEPVRPPYERGQTWFYKVKFDEPYLMYRDWRELARRMLADQNKWTTDYGEPALKLVQARGRSALRTNPITCEPTLASNGPEADQAHGRPGEATSKKAAKRQARARWNATQQLKQHAETGGRPLPTKPKPRTRRAETVLFLDWCYDQLWGSVDGKLPRSELFTQFSQGKGIIRLRDEFLTYCATPEGQARLKPLMASNQPGPVSVPVPDAATAQPQAPPTATTPTAAPAGPFTHTLLVPISVPGSGKTTLARATAQLYPDLGHPQSDMITGKKSKAAQFLALVLDELKQHKVVFADRNNHLFKHRTELVDLVHRIQREGWDLEPVEQPNRKGKGKKGGQQARPTQPPKSAPKQSQRHPRIRMVAINWTFGALRHWEIKEVVCQRIVARGEHHPTLKADTTSPRGQIEHEKIVSMFLSQRQAFEPKAQPLVSGVGGTTEVMDPSLVDRPDGWADGVFHHVVSLSLNATLEENLAVLLQELHNIDPGFVLPSKKAQVAALAQAHQAAEIDWVAGKAAEQREASAQGEAQPKKQAKPFKVRPRYFGLNVPDLDLPVFVRRILSSAEVLPEVREHGEKFLAQLVAEKRLVAEPHVTLVHRNQVKAEEGAVQRAKEKHAPLPLTPGTNAWNAFTSQLEALPPPAAPADSKTRPPPPSISGFDLGVTGVVWSKRVMALLVGPITSSSFPEWNQHLAHDWVPHITVGTPDEDIRPIEGRFLVAAYLAQKLPEGARVAALADPLILPGQLEGMTS